MMRILISAVLVLLSGISVWSQPAKHVILISIDGFRPDFYKDKSWPAPNLQRMMKDGVYAGHVKSVFPSVTYPSHTTIVTGALPARHGIYYNAPKDADNNQWYWEESYIRTPTIWDAVKKAGLTSGAVMWPVTVGAPIDYNFPVRRPNKDEDTDQLEVTRHFVTPTGLLDDIEEATRTKFEKSDFNHRKMDYSISLMANHILATYKPNLMAIHFLSMDHAGHEFGTEGKHLRESLARVDSLIGSVLTTVEKSGMKSQTAIIVTGDHGMVANTTGLAPNIWLAMNGLLEGNDWLAKFHGSGGSAFLYLKDPNDKATLRRVVEILNDVPAAEKKLFRVVNRKQLDAVGANPEPVLALAFAKGVTFDHATEGEVVKARQKGGAHGYFPDFPEIMTGFIAIGAGVNSGVSIPEMGIQDISSLVARLLALDFHSPDGKLHTRILKKR